MGMSDLRACKRRDSPEIAFHFVSTVLQVDLDVQRKLVTITLQQIVIEIKQLSRVLAPDARRQRGRDEQRDVVGWAAVRDHLPVENRAVVIVAIVELALEQQIVAPEVGVSD